MAKLHIAGTGDTGNQGVQTLYLFYCPGCKAGHGFHVPHWSFDGDMNTPTFAPSLKCNGHDPSSICHLSMVKGKIQFLPDCFHALAGQTVDMEDWDE